MFSPLLKPRRFAGVPSRWIVLCSLSLGKSIPGLSAEWGNDSDPISDFSASSGDTLPIVGGQIFTHIGNIAPKQKPLFHLQEHHLFSKPDFSSPRRLRIPHFSSLPLPTCILLSKRTSTSDPFILLAEIFQGGMEGLTP